VPDLVDDKIVLEKPSMPLPDTERAAAGWVSLPAVSEPRE
jgi:hypothetical protein